MDGVRGADLLWRQPVTVQEGSRGRGEMKQWWKNLAQEVCVSRCVCVIMHVRISRAQAMGLTRCPAASPPVRTR